MQPTEKQQQKLDAIADRRKKLDEKQLQLKQKIKTEEVRGIDINAMRNQYAAELMFIDQAEQEILGRIRYRIDD